MNLNKRIFKKTKNLAKVFENNQKAVLTLQESLERKRRELVAEFEAKHQETISALAKKGIDLDKVVARGSRTATASLAAALLFLANGTLPTTVSPKTINSQNLDLNKIIGQVTAKQEVTGALLKSLQENLPNNAGLNAQNEAKLTEEISKITGVKVTAELDGNRLNTNFGKIGQEQHLPLFPGDNTDSHFTNSIAASRYQISGLTRNKGAFGYFAPNKYALTKEALEEEKYYVAVQTYASPGWGIKPGLTDWYKYRKVLVINTQTGAAVVGDIAESGPAKFTGKSFGGSPELMDQLGMFRNANSAKVLVFFVDESGGQVSLGPL